ncbi:MAG: EAL domain-containing protein [Alphaproteobacteria bacterium]
MSFINSEFLQRVESLSRKAKNFEKAEADCAGVCLESLARAVAGGDLVFGYEPWHALYADDAIPQPTEMLLRLKNAEGAALPPYPAIMAFYTNGCVTDIDTILVLAALGQYAAGKDLQVSINVSSVSLGSAEFIKAVLPQVEALNLGGSRKIIFEIHESGSSDLMSKRVLEKCRKLGVLFALDDVGLSLADISRLSAFERIADFVKLDRKSVMANPERKRSLDHVMSVIAATLPFSSVVAEGVKSAEHAAEILRYHPGIHYVQGMHLPERGVFTRQWAEIRGKNRS